MGTETLSLVLGTMGTVTGCLALWHELNQSKVKLRVIPKVVRPGGINYVMIDSEHGDYGDQLCIEVINLSAFAVTLSDVGFMVSVSPVPNCKRLTFIQAPTSMGKTLPVRLEPHEAVTCYSRPDAVHPVGMASVVKAYAETECLARAYGTSPALRSVVRSAASVLRNLGGQ